MKTNFTPGPWTIKGRDVIALDERSTIVCEVTGAISNASASADARLIASAPGLLAQLDRATTLLLEISKAVVTDFPLLTEVQTVYAENRAAIRKATGTAS